MSDSGWFTRPPEPPQATVLVIDDDESMRRLASGMLGRRFRVLEACDVTEGLDVLASESVDLVLMDVMMPGTNGFDGCRCIKAAAKDYLPVLLLTALNGQQDVLDGLEAGADDFLTKPINRRELELRVATFVKLRRQELLIQRQLVEQRALVGLKDDLVNILVHDLRNPLAAVMSIFHLLEQTAADTETKEDVAVGAAAAKKVAELCDDLLMVRLLEEGRLAPTLERQAVGSIVREAVDTLRPFAAERRVRVMLGAREDVTLSLDKKLLRRAVENLLSNAVKYTRESVDVEVLPGADFAEVTVADRGPGIPDAYKSTMFEKYGSVEAREGNARRGVGLGLYMVQLVAAAHHGDVSVEDRDGGGTIFRLRLGSRS